MEDMDDENFREVAANLIEAQTAFGEFQAGSLRLIDIVLTELQAGNIDKEFAFAALTKLFYITTTLTSIQNLSQNNLSDLGDELS